MSGGKFDMDLNEQAQRGYGLLAETAKLNRPDRNRCSTPLKYHQIPPKYHDANLLEGAKDPLSDRVLQQQAQGPLQASWAFRQVLACLEPKPLLEAGACTGCNIQDLE
jgi:hypothetical protein